MASDPKVLAYLNSHLQGGVPAVSYKIAGGKVSAFDAHGDLVAAADLDLSAWKQGAFVYNGQMYGYTNGQVNNLGDATPEYVAFLQAIGVKHVNTLNDQQFDALPHNNYESLSKQAAAQGGTTRGIPPQGMGGGGGGQGGGPGFPSGDGGGGVGGQGGPNAGFPTGEHSTVGSTPASPSGVDPNQPFGQGFGSDLGLNLNQPGGFTGETGPTNPVGPGGSGQGTPNAGVTFPGGTVQTTGVQQVLDSTGTDRHKPDHGLPGPTSLTGTPQPKAPFPSGHHGTGAVTTAPAAATAASVTTASTGQAAPGAGGTTDQKNALATLTEILNQYGLGSLAAWAWNEIVGGASQAQVLLDMMNTPEFKQRFPAIDARQKAGLPPISPADYVNYEAQATQMMRAAGLPAGFWDSPSDFTNLISEDVSLNELSQRVNLASQAAYQVPGDVRAVLQRDYGVTAGDLAANFLDPKQAEPVLARKFTAAQIGGAAYRTGYGSTKGEDEYLTDLGVNAQQAQQGFTQLTGQRQLFSSLPGENAAGISRDMQLGAEFAGNTVDQEAITRRAQQRVGVFSGGGGFGTTQQGFAVGNAQGV